MNSSTIKQDIKAEVINLGFTLVGITPLAPPPHLDVYTNWLASQRHAGMAYLATDRARQRRANPALILPGGQSIITVGMRYPSPLSLAEPQASQPHGRIASYAWGVDYHFVLPERLSLLEKLVSQIAGKQVVAKGYTDTGPILERELAQRAGVGWIGKNTCLIAPHQGSYFLLAELFLDFELEPDPPFTMDACGSCQRCIQACPTQCIRSDRTLDSGRCISYQTIENKASIPADLRPKMGNWVFGCDICQMVCPWNKRFADSGADPISFYPHTTVDQELLNLRPEFPFPDLINDLSLSPQDFNAKFARSPVLRSKHRGYLRNVAIALGNDPDPSSLPVLTETLRHEPETLARGSAAWALGKLNISAAFEALKSAQNTETDPGVLNEIHQSLHDA